MQNVLKECFQSSLKARVRENNERPDRQALPILGRRQDVKSSRSLLTSCQNTFCVGVQYAHMSAKCASCERQDTSFVVGARGAFSCDQGKYMWVCLDCIADIQSL